MGGEALKRVNAYFASLGREPFVFQHQTWEAYLAGQSGLIQAPTGTGKTLAAALGAVIEMIDEGVAKKKSPPLAMIWITPLRALAADTVESLKAALSGLGLSWSIELRTSDTSASVRKRQREKLPTILVTTPESISLLLSYADAPTRFGSLRCIVVDEWHELMSTKRGVQTELALARLRGFQPGLRTWGLSATMSNLDEAASTLLGHAAATSARIIHAPDNKPIALESILPPKIERFPWAGHLGLHLLQEVLPRLEAAGSTLVFTNTRSQSELWFRALMEARPQWLGKIAIHHGSIDRKTRTKVEQMLRAGELRVVVCTSSLDLGVDFWPVDQVIQIGSPKSIARAMQRAGRCGHRPGVESRIVCVPTQAFELIEFSAARHAIGKRHIEPREPITMALDVLAQHVVTVAAGGGFDSRQLFEEVRSTHAFAALTEENWSWVMDFAERGGPTLTAYPRFARIRRDEAGRWTVASDAIGRMHRMSIGTITSDGSVNVQYVSGKRLGTVEESFVAKLKAGDTFAFAGKVLEFVRVHEMSALVRTAKRKRGLVPRWMGGKLAMSSSLADAVRLRMEQAVENDFPDVEMQNIRPILELQRRWSAIPRSSELLIERTKTREGHHLYAYPFQGRLVHEGLSALIAFRLARRGIAPVTATFSDYGLELLSPTAVELADADWRSLLSPAQLLEDIIECVNSSELARRHFREIARIAGLLVQTRPGAQRSVRQLQASSELFFDVFKEFDPGNLLMQQARREVLERQLEFARLRTALERIERQRILMTSPLKLSPLAFPLWAERIASQQLRLESGGDRIARLAQQLEAAADKE
ncbi:MAG TPA: ligase-associated DNA damage response DEXH box helicase [Humisphaera sp.]|jgi:ATP-dependent Lhr-like helicase|nr:ligase-associated DNA damage response DEXH box helicase [Humisphaera sp.]